MKAKLSLKNLLVVSLSVVVCMSMLFTPVMASESELSTGSPGIHSDLDGKNIKDQDESMIDDPEFYEYYEVDKKGKISEKQTDMDEVDAFIAKMDKNAEGINDDKIAEMSSNMTSVGCGVTGVGKGQVPSKYKSYKKYNAIDISWWQNDISASDWKKVKNAGITHVIIRTSYTGLSSSFSMNSDSKFSQNIKRATDAGLKVGVYHFSQATTVSEAKKEADYTLKLIANYKKQITLPVVFDYETNANGRLNGSKIKKLASDGTATKICEAFSTKVKDAGYTPMIYANYTMLTKYLDYKSLQKKYKIWLANYTTNGVASGYPGEYWMWQYSSSGKVSGLSGSIDINYIFDNGQGGALKDNGGSSSSDSSSSSSSSSTSASSSSESSTSVSTSSGWTDKSYLAKAKISVYYRSGPSTKYSKKGVCKKGTEVYVIAEKGSWSKLSTGKYVATHNFKKIKNIKMIKTSFKTKTLNGVNYRTGPSTDYTKVGRYSKGKSVKIIGITGTWGELSNGYFLALKNVDTTVSSSYKAVTTSAVNYRTGPGTSYKLKGTFQKGETIKVVKISGMWAKLSNGYYVSLKYTKPL